MSQHTKSRWHEVLDSQWVVEGHDPSMLPFGPLRGSGWSMGRRRFSADILSAEAIVTPHPEDITQDCTVDINDLLAVISAWV